MSDSVYSSLRAKRSNPDIAICAPGMDCFVASAPRNDGTPSLTLPRKRERERISLFLHLSRLRGRSTREARRVGTNHPGAAP